MTDFLLQSDLLSSLIAFILIFFPAVLIHELGHFLAAKAVGITILEFGVGMPPRAAKLFTWRGTDFTLNYLPLGGFVRPLGEDMIRPVGEETVERDKKMYSARLEHATGASDEGDAGLTAFPDAAPQQTVRPLMSVSEAKPVPRIFFMSAGAIANFISAFLIFAAIGIIGIVEVVGGRVNVVYVEPESALGRAGLLPGDFIEELNGENFADSDEFFTRLNALHDEEAHTLTVIRGDTGAVEDIPFTYIPSTRGRSANFVRVMAVVRDSPAERAGMLPGDLMLDFNGLRLENIEDLIRRTREQAGNEVVLTLRRGGEQLDISLVPRVNPPEGEGAMGIAIQPAFGDPASTVIYQEGVPRQKTIAQPPLEALGYSLDRIAGVVNLIVEVPVQLIRGEASVESARPVSVVGISQVGGEFLQQSIEEDRPVVILNFVALISVLLGLTNLLPLPALDGGRIFFVLIEIVRGKPVAPEREGFVHLIGLALLLSLTVVIILNDLINPITNLIP